MSHYKDAIDIMKKLSKRQAEILIYINKYNRINGAYPSIRKIADNFKVNFQSIQDVMNYLVAKEYIIKDSKGKIESAKNVHGEVGEMVDALYSLDIMYKKKTITQEEYENIKKSIIKRFIDQDN